MIAMPQNIPHSTKAFPVRSWTLSFSVVAQSLCGLRNNLHLAFNGRLRFYVGFVRFQIHIAEKGFDVIQALQKVSQMRFIVSKRQGLPHEEPLSAQALASIRVTTAQPARRAGRLIGFADSRF
jgi:hypothetical protein